ncbi:MAG: aminoacetone oxidase family FAD-binding enzyme [Bacilli bacterium]|nr:aminoacetone oxidase family FAD-binding enzyme [Bacilli bacterium]
MYDVVIIGAGPAGMMAAIQASKKNKVLLIEKNDKIGEKLELTGGTRCNLINLKNIADFIKEIPVNNKALYSSLNKFSPQDIYDYFNMNKVFLKVEDNDRVFPVSNKAKTIIDFFNNEIKNKNIDLHLNEYVKDIIITDEYKIVSTNNNEYTTNKIVLATGGCSYPQTGSTGDGFRISKNINQPVTKLYPAETFLISKNKLDLAGLTIENVKIKLNNYIENGSLLFTHQGISGPACFKISEKVYKQLQEEKEITLQIDLLPELSNEQILNKINEYNQKKEVISFLKEILPKRIAEYIIKKTNINTRIAELSKTNKNILIENIKQFEIQIIKTGSIEQSFVTGGGIDMKYINSKTMESTINKGVYYAGEILDIHGHTGGYNITIALSTGYNVGSQI